MHEQQMLTKKKHQGTSSLKSLGARKILDFAYTAWLFNLTDLKTIVGPTALFALLGALAGPVLTTTDAAPSFSTLLYRTPITILWLWVNVLLFTLDNQRQAGGIEEDRLNKPWRPIPAKRITPEQTFYTLLAMIPVAIVFSALTGPLRECLVLLFLNCWYNNWGGGDTNWFVRSFLNGLGFINYGAGALRLATQAQISEAGVQWLLVYGLVVLSTIQVQDLRDLEGDRARGRRTLPVIIGDVACRWAVAVPVMFWSFFCPYFWRLSLAAYIPSVVLGAHLSWRVLCKRTVQDDRTSLDIWSIWLASFYFLPCLKNVS